MDFKSRPPLFLTAGKCTFTFTSVWKQTKPNSNVARLSWWDYKFFMQLLSAIWIVLTDLESKFIQGILRHRLGSQKSVGYTMVSDLYHWPNDEHDSKLFSIKFMSLWMVVFYACHQLFSCIFRLQLTICHNSAEIDKKAMNRNRKNRIPIPAPDT